MKGKDLLTLFKETRALLKGHFLLSSGLHSGEYFQCALVVQYPQHAERLGKMLAQKFKQGKINYVVGPALGGIIIAYEVARALRARALFTERKEAKMQLRRGFTLTEKDRVLVIEDVVTTGLSVKETIQAIRNFGAKIVGVGSIVDRSTVAVDFDLPYKSLLKMKVETFQSDICPLCKSNLPLVKPGSR